MTSHKVLKNSVITPSKLDALLEDISFRAASNSSIEAGAFNIALMSLDRHGFTQFRQRIVTVVALDEEELKCIAKSRTESTEPLSPLG